MTDKDDGRPAFPSEQGHTPEGTWNQTYAQGMTLRDWFAGRVDIADTIGFLNRDGCEELVGKPMPSDFIGMLRWRCEVIAAIRYLSADAMIAERAK